MVRYAGDRCGCPEGDGVKRPVLAILRFYKRAVSPLLPPACRFHPTCSEYAYEAVEKYGIIKGGRLAVWRILRCNPFCKGGWDPVP
ncbi:MAG TPA: membrane protein insertion efficiency factor YidD [Thermomicrobiales bacterium]|nr:membrane protein insertion efficiency factor YidD [Thermomicrobiales bacterium]